MGLIYDEQSMVSDGMYKYDKYLHSRINKYTGDARTLVKYWNINDEETTTSVGMATHYQILGKDSPLRYDEIDNMIILGFQQITPENGQLSQTGVRNYNINGQAYIIPGTIMPKENDFFIVKHLNMEHIFRVTQVDQDGLNTDGSYRISYSLFSTNPQEICNIHKQTVGHFVMDLQTIGGSDLTPVIGKEDYEYRSKLIRMVNDMIENYNARFYDPKHNCYLLHLNGRTLFDFCGNMFMARHGVMIRDNSNGNVVLNENKLRDRNADEWYQLSPYKWIERDAPLSYLDPFKYHIVKSSDYPESSFFKYGDDIDIMIPNPAWCQRPFTDMYFPMAVYELLDAETDTRPCCECDCKCCDKRPTCERHHKCKRRDYVSLIHYFIHGELTSIHDLSLFIGDQLFDNSMSQEVYLWTPIIIYIIKQILKIK